MRGWFYFLPIHDVTTTVTLLHNFLNSAHWNSLIITPFSVTDLPVHHFQPILSFVTVLSHAPTTCRVINRFYSDTKSRPVTCLLYPATATGLGWELITWWSSYKTYLNNWFWTQSPVNLDALNFLGQGSGVFSGSSSDKLNATMGDGSSSLIRRHTNRAHVNCWCDMSFDLNLSNY